METSYLREDPKQIETKRVDSLCVHKVSEGTSVSWGRGGYRVLLPPGVREDQPSLTPVEGSRSPCWDSSSPLCPGSVRKPRGKRTKARPCSGPQERGGWVRRQWTPLRRRILTQLDYLFFAGSRVRPFAEEVHGEGVVETWGDPSEGVESTEDGVPPYLLY